MSTETVTLEATARLDGFAPIGIGLRLLGYRCASCGLEQAPPGEFAVSKWGLRGTESGKALDAALESLGLST